MSGVYLDTSALARVLLGETDARAIETALGGFERITASRLLAVELHRVGLRTGLTLAARRLLGGVSLVPLDETLFTAAETILPASVPTLDAVHLATAVSLAAAGVIDCIMTFDRRLIEGAEQHGLPALSPA